MDCEVSSPREVNPSRPSCLGKRQKRLTRKGERPPRRLPTLLNKMDELTKSFEHFAISLVRPPRPPACAARLGSPCRRAGHVATARAGRGPAIQDLAPPLRAGARSDTRIVRSRRSCRQETVHRPHLAVAGSRVHARRGRAGGCRVAAEVVVVDTAAAVERVSERGCVC